MGVVTGVWADTGDEDAFGFELNGRADRERCTAKFVANAAMDATLMMWPRSLFIMEVLAIRVLCMRQRLLMLIWRSISSSRSS